MTKRKHTPQRQSWVTGTSCFVPKKLTAFERKAQSLAIDPEGTEACAASPELMAWVNEHKSSHYVPVELLSHLKLTNDWDAGEKEDRRLPKFSLWDAQQANPVPAI
jgi:hypothetical protein